MSTGERPRSNIAIVMIACNESKNIGFSLRSVVGWAEQVFVVDSGSKDDTVELARSLGATVVHQSWLGYAKQKNWAIETLPITTDWVFILDADEAILPELREELEAIARRPASEASAEGYYVNRYFIFLGKRIRHCGYYPSWNLRFFRRGRARYEEREVHEHMVVDGRVAYLKGHMEHYDRRGLEVYMDKHNKYSTLEAREIVRVMRGGESGAGLDAKPFGNSLQRRRWIKHVVYPRLPAKGLARFLYMYVFRLGVLDGLTGLRFSLFISAYEMLIGLKIIELQQEERERAAGPSAGPAPARPASASRGTHGS